MASSPGLPAAAASPVAMNRSPCPSPNPIEGVAPLAGETYSIVVGESFAHDADHR